MAKYRVLFICLFGLICFKTLTLGQQYAPDPSLEEIKSMDAQEGLPRDFIPNKDKDNTINSFDDKGPYDKPDVIDTRGVSSRLIDDKSTKDKWDKDLKKRNIVNKFDTKVAAVFADSEEFPTEQETSLSAEEETGESKSENTIPETETSLEHSDYETKIDTQPVLELNEVSVQNNVEIFDPREEEFEILTEENETQIEEEESENYIVENNEVGVVEPEIAEEEIQTEKEENETRTDDEEQDNGITEYIQVGELQPGIEEEETQTETTEEEEYPEYDVVGNNENEDIEYEMDEEEIETETEDNTSEAGTNEMANQTEEPVSRLENEEIYDKEAVPDTKGLDTNVDVPQFMTDFHLQQKDPEMGVNSFPVEKMDPACHLPPVTGFCRAAFRRFYFNSETGECHTFIFGGCSGNENNFETMEECMDTCSNVRV